MDCRCFLCDFERCFTNYIPLTDSQLVQVVGFKYAKCQELHVFSYSSDAWLNEWGHQEVLSIKYIYIHVLRDEHAEADKNFLIDIFTVDTDYCCQYTLYH